MRLWIYYVPNQFPFVKFCKKWVLGPKVRFSGLKSPNAPLYFRTCDNLSKSIWLFSSSMLLCNILTTFKLKIKWFWRNFYLNFPRLLCISAKSGMANFITPNKPSSYLTIFIWNSAIFRIKRMSFLSIIFFKHKP